MGAVGISYIVTKPQIQEPSYDDIIQDEPDRICTATDLALSPALRRYCRQMAPRLDRSVLCNLTTPARRTC